MPRRSDASVEADETLIGGEPHTPRGKAARTLGGRNTRDWWRNKLIVLGDRAWRADPLPRRSQQPPRHGRGVPARDVVAEEATAIYTHEPHTYAKLGHRDTAHEAVNHSAVEWVRGVIHATTVESVWSLLDRAVIGSHHKLSATHMPTYLQEFEWRYNNRENPYLFRDTLVQLVTAGRCHTRALTA